MVEFRDFDGVGIAPVSNKLAVNRERHWKQWEKIISSKLRKNYEQTGTNRNKQESTGMNTKETIGRPRSKQQRITLIREKQIWIAKSNKKVKNRKNLW